jgi:uncharacterized delta-60 repeat protein
LTLGSALAALSLTMPTAAGAVAGDIDTSFSGDGRQLTSFSNGEADDVAYDAVVDGNGRIVVVGESDQSAQNRGLDFAIARYNPDGTYDDSFSGDGRRLVSFGENGDDRARGVAIDPNGRIVVVGHVRKPGGAVFFGIARLKGNGVLDDSFDENGLRLTAFDKSFLDSRATDVAVQPNGKIIAVGVSDQNKTGKDFAFARYLDDGSYDAGFSKDGRRTVPFTKLDRWDQANAVALQPNGRIVAAGFHNFTYTGSMAMVRLNPNGTLDTGFTGDGKKVFFGNPIGTATANDVTIRPSGKILVAGYRYLSGTGSDFALARLHSDGTLDSSLSGDGKQTQDFFGFADEAQAVLVQDNYYNLVGSADYSNSFPQDYDFAIARFSSHDGSLDTTYKGGGLLTTYFDNGNLDDIANAVVPLADPTATLLVGSSVQPGKGNDFALVSLKSEQDKP